MKTKKLPRMTPPDDTDEGSHTGRVGSPGSCDLGARGIRSQVTCFPACTCGREDWSSHSSLPPSLTSFLPSNSRTLELAAHRHALPVHSQLTWPGRCARPHLIHGQGQSVSYSAVHLRPESELPSSFQLSLFIDFTLYSLLSRCPKLAPRRCCA